jgi:hypothetical protein
MALSKGVGLCHVSVVYLCKHLHTCMKLDIFFIDSELHWAIGVGSGKPAARPHDVHINSNGLPLFEE